MSPCWSLLRFLSLVWPLFTRCIAVACASAAAGLTFRERLVVHDDLALSLGPFLTQCVVVMLQNARAQTIHGTRHAGCSSRYDRGRRGEAGLRCEGTVGGRRTAATVLARERWSICVGRRRRGCAACSRSFGRERRSFLRSQRSPLSAFARRRGAVQGDPKPAERHNSRPHRALIAQPSMTTTTATAEERACGPEPSLPRRVRSLQSSEGTVVRRQTTSWFAFE